MPQGDRTGPEGRGPRTGRARGYCSGNDRPGYRASGFRGRGQGRGFGRCRGFRFREPVYQEQYFEPVQLTKSEQKKILEAELAEIEAEKKQIEKELKSLK